MKTVSPIPTQAYHRAARALYGLKWAPMNEGSDGFGPVTKAFQSSPAVMAWLERHPEALQPSGGMDGFGTRKGATSYAEGRNARRRVTIRVENTTDSIGVKFGMIRKFPV